MADDDRKQKCPKCEVGSPAWMTTFGDMNNLLLTFFVAILTSAKIEGRELRLILSAFEGSFGMLDGGMTLSSGELAEMGQTIESLPSREVANQLSKAMREVSELLKPELQSREVRIQEVTEGYLMTLASDIFFGPGSAEIDFEQAQDVLNTLGAMLKELDMDYTLKVVGHTDNTDIPSASTLSDRFPSNWELSTARACAVVRWLEDFGIDPELMYAEGKGEHDPLESNDTPEGRAYNRRIDIYLIPDIAE